MDYRPTVEYQQAYPDSLVSEIVSAASEGVEGTGVATAKLGALTPIVDLLNSAWQEFWRAPEDYQAWEAKRYDELRRSLRADW